MVRHIIGFIDTTEMWRYNFFFLTDQSGLEKERNLTLEVKKRGDRI
jgi:hypothetical protein